MARSIEIRFNTERCKGCELCVSVCPNDLLYLSKQLNKKGYATVSITDEAKCIGCFSCAMICPDLVITLFDKEEQA